jgi:O-antigen/teichoic acid export membrane protein
LSAVRASGDVVRMGSEKLIVLPVMLSVLGVHDVGRVLIALAWTRALLGFPITAVNNGLMRMHSAADRCRAWPDLLLAGISTGAAAAIVLGVLGWCGGVLMVSADQLSGYGSMLLALGLGTLVTELRRLATADLRLQLRFGTVSATEALEGLLLLAAIPLARAFGVAGLVGALLLCPLPGLLWTLSLTRETLSRASGAWHGWLRALGKVSLGFVGVTAIGQLLNQLARLVLGAVEGPSSVAVFFAAEASVMLLLMPVHYLGTVLFTLLAKKGSRDEIDSKAMRQHVVGSIGAAMLFYATALVFCPWLVRVLYRDVAAAALPIVKVLVPGAAFRLLFMSALPFHYRFAPMSTILALSLSTLLVSGALIVLLAVRGGLAGVALGVTLGNVVMGVVWFGIHSLKTGSPGTRAKST